jgi:DNA replication protein DnaC
MNSNKPPQHISTALNRFLSGAGNGDGEAKLAEWNRVHAEQEARTREARIAQRWRDSGVSDRHKNQISFPAATLKIPSKHAGWEPNLRAMQQCAKAGSVVLVTGRRGAGKTLASAVLTAEYCAADRSAKYAILTGFYLALKATFDGVGNELEALQRFIAPDLLILDEIGEKPPSDWAGRLLTYLVDLRYGTMKPTLLIGNLKPAELTPIIGPSIMDRARDGGAVIQFDWASLRGAIT